MDVLADYHILLSIIALFLSLFVVFPFVYKEIRKKRESRKLINRIKLVSSLSEEDMASIETMHPSGKKMHPTINTSICVGCGTCVAACREKGALYVVNGKSTLIDPLSCKAYGDCAEACPMGANQLAEYGKKLSLKVPMIDENFESNIPGVYVIGSLTGAGLIKEAINQGRAVINHIMKDVFPDKMPRILVVGAGPAGLSAVLSGRKFGLETICLEKEGTANTIKNFPKRKIIMAEPVDMPLFGPLWVGNTSREKLLEVWDSILHKTRVKIEVGFKLEGIRKTATGFIVTASGRSFSCDKVIIASGTRGEPRKLNVPGEDLPHVFYKLTDAGEFSGFRVAVVGAGDSAIEAALALVNQNCRLTLLVRGKGFPKAKDKNRERIEDALARKLLTVKFESRALEIRSESLIYADAEGERDLESDYVFILVGGQLPLDLLKRIGIEITEMTY